jgi:mono/diheme cytochrome c family protein
MRPFARTALAVALAPTWLACRAADERPGWVVMPEMYRSLSYKPYDPNPNTATGQTLMLPPEGTVAMGGHPFPCGAGPEEAQRAGRELRNPTAADPASLERGRRVFDTVCAVCHGPQGQGDGPIIGRFPNPPSLQADRAKGLPDGQVFHIITRGQGIMPSHAAQVLAEDRWKVILYLRQLQGVGPPPAPPPPTEPAPTAGGRP